MPLLAQEVLVYVCHTGIIINIPFIILALKQLKEITGAPLAVHENSKTFLKFKSYSKHLMNVD